MTRGSISKDPWVGSNLLDYPKSVPLTDASPTYSAYVQTDRITDFVLDINTDKGTTVVFTPILSETDLTKTREDSITGVVSDGGEKAPFTYSKLKAPQLLVTVTKTEAGDSTFTDIHMSGSSS